MANTKTLQDARDLFYSILKEDEDTSAYPLVLADALMNNIEQDICSWVLTDLTSWNLDQLEKWPLPFLYSDKYYTTVLDTFIDDDNTAVWWVTLSCSNSTWFASSWLLWVNEDIISYTWNTGTWFTWVTWIDFAHKSWARVSQLFTLPTDYATPNRVIYNNQRALKSKDYRDVYLQLNDSKADYWVNWTNGWTYGLSRFSWDVVPFYTIIQWQYFLPFQLNNAGYMIHMIYEKIPTTMTDWVDLSTIPDKYSQVTTPVLAAADILYNRWEEDRALKLHRFGLWKVNSMYSFYANQNNESLHGQRIRTWKDQILNI